MEHLPPRGADAAAASNAVDAAAEVGNVIDLARRARASGAALENAFTFRELRQLKRLAANADQLLELLDTARTLRKACPTWRRVEDDKQQS